MPIYDYDCSECGGHFEATRGVECSSTPCPVCGTAAARAFCSGLPAIHGETVGRGAANSGAVNKHGLIDLNLVQEAQAEVLEDCTKAGVEPPDMFKRAKERVARGKVETSRIAR